VEPSHGEVVAQPRRVQRHRPPGTRAHLSAQLTVLVKTRLKEMRYRPGLLDGFLASTGLDLTPFCNPHH